MRGYDPDKYALFKRVSHEQPDSAPTYDGHLVLLDPETYFVLRRSDFAGRLALRSYIQGLLLMLDLNAQGLATLSEEEVEHLSLLADEASALADRWDQNEHRVAT